MNSEEEIAKLDKEITNESIAFALAAVGSLFFLGPLQRAQRFIQTQPLNSNILYRQVFRSTIDSGTFFSLYKPFYVNQLHNTYFIANTKKTSSIAEYAKNSFNMNLANLALYFVESVGTIATIQSDTIKRGYIKVFQDLRAQKRVYRGFGATFIGFNLAQSLSYLQWELFSSKESKPTDSVKYLISLTSFAAAYPFFSVSRRMIADSLNTELHYKSYKQLFNEVKLTNLYKGWQAILVFAIFQIGKKHE